VTVSDIDKQRGRGCAQTSSISTLYHRDRILLSPHHFLPANRLPLSIPHFFPYIDMSDQSGSSRLRVLFEAALEDYRRQTGIELAEHPLAERLQDGNTVESVIAILCEQAQDFKQFREKDKVLKPLKRVLTVLNILPSAVDFAQGVGLVCP
jgi:hypothetical protein